MDPTDFCYAAGIQNYAAGTPYNSPASSSMYPSYSGNENAVGFPPVEPPGPLGNYSAPNRYEMQIQVQEVKYEQLQGGTGASTGSNGNDGSCEASYGIYPSPDCMYAQGYGPAGQQQFYGELQEGSATVSAPVYDNYLGSQTNTQVQWIQNSEANSFQQTPGSLVTIAHLLPLPPRTASEVTAASPAESPVPSTPPSRRCSGKRPRTTYSPLQIMALEKFYEEHDKYINRTKRIEIAMRLDLTERQVKVWFQNKRMKAKQEAKAKGLQSEVSSSQLSADAGRRLPSALSGAPSAAELQISGSSSPVMASKGSLASSSSTQVKNFPAPNQGFQYCRSGESEPSAINTDHPPQLHQPYPSIDFGPGPSFFQTDADIIPGLTSLKLQSNDHC